MKELIKKFIPEWLLNIYHLILAFLGALVYRFPSRELKMIGVTGTNGKTTVVEMIFRILGEAGYKVALANSIRFKIGKKEWPNELRMTMPGRFKLQRFLREAVDSGCKFAVLEVTSEGIKQYRHKFIDFEVAIFTNLTPEHIEAHGSFGKYRGTKGRLFQATKNIHVINIDDENAEYFLQFPAKKKYTYGLNKGDIDNRDLQLNLQLIGNFNIYNALAAICAGLSQGISLEKCKEVIEKIEGIPGRMELVISEPFKVFVDYAFTPNALRKVYETLLKSKIKNRVSIYGNDGEEENGVFFAHQKSKMICVLGACGGGRDKWKRPVLGELAAKYCDEVIITNEDPYDEDPMEIIEHVAKGAENISINQPNQHKSAVLKILDRREAIREALRLAKPNDIVVITGKGCEPSICLAGGKKIPWDDRRVVQEEFKKLHILHFPRP